MKKKQRLTALLLAGTVILSPSLVGQEQELEQRVLAHEEGISMEEEDNLPVTEEATETPLTAMEAAIKEVLGNIYAQTLGAGGLQHEQWLDLEPIAEAYIREIWRARSTRNDAEANSIAKTAYLTFEAEISAKLSENQKNARMAWKAELDAWNKRVEEYVLSPEVREAVNRQMKATGSTRYDLPPEVIDAVNRELESKSGSVTISQDKGTLF